MKDRATAASGQSLSYTQPMPQHGPGPNRRALGATRRLTQPHPGTHRCLVARPRPWQCIQKTLVPLRSSLCLSSSLHRTGAASGDPGARGIDLRPTGEACPKAQGMLTTGLPETTQWQKKYTNTRFEWSLWSRWARRVH